MDEAALRRGERAACKVGFEGVVEAFHFGELGFGAVGGRGGEVFGDVSHVELHAAGDVAEQLLGRIGGIGRVLVVELHGEGNKGFAQFVEVREAGYAVCQGQAAVLGQFPQILGEAGDHGVGGDDGCTAHWIAHAGFVANEVVDQTSVVCIVRGEAKKLDVKNHPHQIGQLDSDFIEPLPDRRRVAALQECAQKRHGMQIVRV